MLCLELQRGQVILIRKYYKNYKKEESSILIPEKIEMQRKRCKKEFQRYRILNKEQVTMVI